MNFLSKIVFSVVIFTLLSLACFAQEISISVKESNASKDESETVSSDSELCFNPEKKKPELKAIKYETKINGEKVIVSDCCPIQVFTTKVPKIIYPQTAKTVRAQGIVSVRVYVNEKGKVFWAEVESGHPLLRAVALRAACRTVFKPYVCYCGKKRREQFQAIISYNFVL